MYEKAMIEMQAALTALPALSPDSGGQGEYEKAQYLLSQLREWGFPDITEINAPDARVPSGSRPNILAALPGRNPEMTVWILTHMDIVPPGELSFWDSDPYKVAIKADTYTGGAPKTISRTWSHHCLQQKLFSMKESCLRHPSVLPSFPMKKRGVNSGSILY
jgi:acetylornithine deacetylase/succinyl-diaminopimelate desuccinylase-like protein